MVDDPHDNTWYEVVKESPRKRSKKISPEAVLFTVFLLLGLIGGVTYFTIGGEDHVGKEVQ